VHILILKPCCIGDVIFATPLLQAIQKGYPGATIDWAVGSSAIAALRDHPAIHTLINTGPQANPARRPTDLLRLAGKLHESRYDRAFVPDRSPVLGIATLLAGIPRRVGLDSAGRGFAYSIRAPIVPSVVRHESEIYLDLARVMGLPVEDCWANVVPGPEAVKTAETILAEIGTPPIIVHPGGGVNAGMAMIQKRWPASHFAVLADRLSEALHAPITLIGTETDQDACEAFLKVAHQPVIDLRSKRLSLATVAALAAKSVFYIGNDNGVGHLAAAAGARVIMIFGPSDPRRYAPFVPEDRALAAWHPVVLPSEGVSSGKAIDFEWARDGIGVDEVWERARAKWQIGLA
jgi:ADP-heptose:LPS heptosyltransferase